MATKTPLVNNNVGGIDNIIVLTDANRNQWTIEADSTSGNLITLKNGTQAGAIGAGGNAYAAISAKPASATLTSADAGYLITTTGGSGAITFTLPAAASNTGVTFQFYNTVDQNMIIAAPAGTLVAFNNAAATSVAFSTAGNKIGGGGRVTSDGSKWLFQNMSAGANTVTVA